MEKSIGVMDGGSGDYGRDELRWDVNPIYTCTYMYKYYFNICLIIIDTMNLDCGWVITFDTVSFPCCTRRNNPVINSLTVLIIEHCIYTNIISHCVRNAELSLESETLIPESQVTRYVTAWPWPLTFYFQNNITSCTFYTEYSHQLWTSYDFLLRY